MDAKASSKKKQGKDQQEQVQKKMGATISEFIVANIKLFGIGAGVIVVILILIFGWTVYKKSLNEKAIVLENEAFDLFNTLNSETKPEKATTPAKSYQDVLNIYQQIIAQYPGTASAERAVYLSGSLEYTLGNYEKAQQDFNTYITRYPNGNFRLQAEESLGYIFEQQGAYQKAIDQFKSIETKVSPSRRYQLLLAIGRNYESLKQVDPAVKIYQSILEAKDTSESWKDKAKERLDILQTGVAPTVVSTPAEAPKAATPEVVSTPAEAPKAATPEAVSTPAEAPKASNP